jgi:hypothetical protein
MRDSDGYLIEVGQYTEIAFDWGRRGGRFQGGFSIR